MACSEHVPRAPARLDQIIETVGLTESQVRRLRAAYGPNELPATDEPSVLRRALGQLMEPLSLVLVVAALASWLVLGHEGECLAIAAIVALNVSIGAVQERRAADAVAALAQTAAPLARVRRSGRTVEIPASDVVPSDLLELAAGDRVAADVELIHADSLAIDESMITGEAKPSEKIAHHVSPTGAALGDRTGDAFAGTLVVRGRGAGVVRATGARTELGGIARQLGDETLPPLVKELRSLARQLSLVAGLLGAALIPVAIWRGDGSRQALLDAVLAGIALAIAAVPEGVATVVTTALALGAHRMAGRGAIVRRLQAIEALGSASVICCDKTGTITSGKLAVASVVARQGQLNELWLISRRCNDAVDGVGDPVDVALLAAACAAGSDEPTGSRLAERPFDTTTRSMTTVHSTEKGPVLSVKGAPEAVFARCRPDTVEPAFTNAVQKMTARSLRVMAVAEAQTADLDSDDLTAIGVIGLEDPLRRSARQSIADCQRAGIRVVLVTGDHVATARAVAESAGLTVANVVSGRELNDLPDDQRTSMLRNASVIARVDPSTKVDLVRAHQAAGDIVAMTGDGVNDAPALRRADVGVAIGRSADTAVARAAAGIIVTDGDLSTLVSAIAEGRRIYRNIRNVISYLITGNISEVMVVVLTLVLFPQLAIPLLPIQLLWINLVTDGPPALAIGVDDVVGDPLDDGRAPTPTGCFVHGASSRSPRVLRSLQCW
jgi:P-type Ca2+ transporter type 2C